MAMRSERAARAPAAAAWRSLPPPRAGDPEHAKLLDDLVGRRFTLNGAGDPLQELAPGQLQELHALGFRFVSLAKATYLDRRPRAWLDAHSAQAVMIRPDLHGFGAVEQPAQLPELVEDC
jgi:3-(3-hydroxy-phenyl)propionate hydroxylase